MSEAKPNLSGSDLTQGVALSALADGAMLLGHAHGEPALLARRDKDVFAIAAVCTHYPGVERWLELHEMAGSGGRQPPANKLTWASMESLRVPMLLLTGDADLYMPPSNMREILRHLPHSEAAIISEVAHSAYWEQPEVFNRELLRFLGKHSKR